MHFPDTGVGAGCYNPYRRAGLTSWASLGERLTDGSSTSLVQQAETAGAQWVGSVASSRGLKSASQRGLTTGGLLAQLLEESNAAGRNGEL
jgi:hypothetical protein